MADEASKPIDFRSVLEEAKQTVESWPAWQQRYEADIYYEGYPSAEMKTIQSTDHPAKDKQVDSSTGSELQIQIPFSPHT